MNKQLNVVWTRDQRKDLSGPRAKCITEVLARVDRYSKPFFSKMPLPAEDAPPADSAPSSGPGKAVPYGEYWWLAYVRKALRALND